MESLLEKHSSEFVILALMGMVLAALIVIIPQVLKAHQKNLEFRNAERLKALDLGLPMPPIDDRVRAAGRTAVLVPTVAVISAGTVTCFLVAYRAETVLAVSIAVWCVAGIVSMAAITGGVALVGRLAQIESGDVEEPQKIKT
jgi:hypothetical protein